MTDNNFDKNKETNSESNNPAPASNNPANPANLESNNPAPASNDSANPATQEKNSVPEERIKENKMGVLPIGRLMISMSVPPSITMLLNALYNIVESIFVAQYSPQALTAITIVFPVQMIMITIATGSGFGLNSLISRRLGEKRQAEADNAASQSVFIVFFNWLIFVLFGVFLARPFLALFTKNPVILEDAVLYCKMVTIGSIALFIVITIEKILQSTGNMLQPMIFNIAGALINVVLSFLLIPGWFGLPKLGLFGAGIACLCSQFTAMIIALVILFKYKHSVKLKFKGLKFKGKTIKEIYAVGLPSIINMSLGSFMMAGLNAILSYSEAAIAVLGIYYRINQFAFMPIFGLNQGTLSLLAYNFGARNKKRLLQALKIAIIASCCIMAVGTAVFWILPSQLLSLFNATDEMLRIGVPALRIISSTFLIAGVAVSVSGLFQALAYAHFSMIAGFLRQIVLILPLAYFLLKFYGDIAVWASISIAELLSLIMTLFFIKYVYNKEVKHLGEGTLPTKEGETK